MMNILSREKQIAVISMLVEGASIRSTERVTGVHRDSICRRLVRVGNHCETMMRERLRGIECESIQADDIWCYVNKKQKRMTPDDPSDFGNI